MKTFTFLHYKTTTTKASFVKTTLPSACVHLTLFKPHRATLVTLSVQPPSHHGVLAPAKPLPMPLFFHAQAPTPFLSFGHFFHVTLKLFNYVKSTRPMGCLQHLVFSPRHFPSLGGLLESPLFIYCLSFPTGTAGPGRPGLLCFIHSSVSKDQKRAVTQWVIH